MTSPPIVTRFAPSPTGNLHIGGARTALFAWAFARKHGGQLILRIEDTDLARSTPQSTKGILRDLKWLGLDWDQGPKADAEDPYAPEGQKGDHGPYFQSQRHKEGIYDKLIQKLLDSGKAYEDGDAVRFRMDETIGIKDAIFGDIIFLSEDQEDFIIRKGDKGGRLPTFHFAVTVDDALMGVTHVIRGQEHLTNTPKHAALCDALGFTRPNWVHLPSIMNADGSKMSKRDKAKALRASLTQTVENIGHNALLDEVDRRQKYYQNACLPFNELDHTTVTSFIEGDDHNPLIVDTLSSLLDVHLPEIDVKDFQKSGYLPQVLLNYIALLGWNPGDDTERFDLDFLVEHFRLERIGKKNSQFDRAKLAKFNAEALAQMTADQFHDLLLEHMQSYRSSHLGILDEEKFRTFAKMYQSRSTTLDNPFETGRFFFCRDDVIEYNPKAVKKNLIKNDGEGLRVLRLFRNELDACNDWTADTLHSLIESFVEKKQLKNMGSVAQPLRVAMTGNAVSPEIGPTLELLGKETVLNRIDRCVEAVSP